MWCEVMCGVCEVMCGVCEVTYLYKHGTFMCQAGVHIKCTY